MSALERVATHEIAPRRGWLDVAVTLRHYAITTFAVPPERVERHLAPGFDPEVFTLAGGQRRAFVSAVSFLDVGFRLRAVPWPRFRFGQTNYRAYVLHRGERCAWFFGTSLATAFVLVPRIVWGMPWHHARMRFDCEWQGERCDRYRLETTGRWGAASIDAQGTDEPMGVLDGFTSEDETRAVVTHPTDGYFRRPDGRVSRYSIWHAPLAMRRAIPRTVRLEAFESLGVIDAGEAPHSVLLQRETDYVIHLPPRAI